MQPPMCALLLFICAHKLFINVLAYPNSSQTSRNPSNVFRISSIPQSPLYLALSPPPTHPPSNQHFHIPIHTSYLLFRAHTNGFFYNSSPPTHHSPPTPTTATPSTPHIFFFAHISTATFTTHLHPHTTPPPTPTTATAAVTATTSTPHIFFFAHISTASFTPHLHPHTTPPYTRNHTHNRNHIHTSYLLFRAHTNGFFYNSSPPTYHSPFTPITATAAVTATTNFKRHSSQSRRLIND